MNRTSRPIFQKARCFSLLLALLLLSACATYSPGHPYPRYGYSYQTSAAYYSHPYTYYGRYQPGWFVAGPYFPGNYWGFGAMVYWPTYSSSYYYSNHYYSDRYYHGRYYPYSDPWYYPYSGHYRHVYGHYYGPWNGPYYGYERNGAYGYGHEYNRPYDRNSHSYRPPARQDYPPERRSTTVVAEREGMSRNVGVAPAGNSNQGMVVSNRSERKVRPSRLHPVTADQNEPGPVSVGPQGKANRIPRQPNVPVAPNARITTNPGYVVEPAEQAVAVPGRRNSAAASAVFRSPGRSNPPVSGNQAVQARPQVTHPQRPDADSAGSRANLRQRGNIEPGRDRGYEQDRGRGRH